MVVTMMDFNSDKIQNDPTTDAERIEAIKASSRRTVILETIIEYTADRMAYGAYKPQIKREISCMLFGEDPTNPGIPLKMMAVATYEGIRSRARSLIRLRVSESTENAKFESLAYWRHLMTDPEVPFAVKARARENVDTILGVKMPLMNVNVNLPASDTVKLSDLGLDLEARKAALQNIRAASERCDDASASADNILAEPLPEVD